VKGFELVIMDEGQAGYMVVFSSTASTAASFLGAGTFISDVINVASCRAATFLSAGQAGLPNLAVAGYRYRVIGVT
jgi:hypothetical protein